MSLGDDFRRLADAYIEEENLAAKRRRELGSVWDKLRVDLNAICKEITDAASEYAQFSAGFSCPNGECSLLMSLKGGPSHELRIRLDRDLGVIVATASTDKLDQTLDPKEPFERLTGELEEKVRLFQERFFEGLKEKP